MIIRRPSGSNILVSKNIAQNNIKINKYKTEFNLRSKFPKTIISWSYRYIE